MTERKGNELLQEYVRLTHEWHARVLGYGFSYCYTRAFAGLAPFADANAHEDWQFVIDCVSAGGAVTQHRVRLHAACMGPMGPRARAALASPQAAAAD